MKLEHSHYRQYLQKPLAHRFTFLSHRETTHPETTVKSPSQAVVDLYRDDIALSHSLSLSVLSSTVLLFPLFLFCSKFLPSHSCGKTHALRILDTCMKEKKKNRIQSTFLLRISFSTNQHKSLKQKGH